jgi:triacylglycerol esterase/lipase EstA (alpha/beta hydrolase family)
MRRATFLLLPVLALLAACSTPIGVVRVGTQEAHRALTANVLSAGRPSEWSRQVLHRNALFERYTEDPAAALGELHKLLQNRVTPDRLFALAELSFLQAQEYGPREHYLAAAAYAYAFLLPEHEKTAVLPIDPRARLAVDIYNQGLAEGLTSADGEEVVLQSRTHRLPFGELSVSIDPSQFEWAGYRFKRFVPVGHFVVRGLRNRYRQSGAGAPLAADVEPAGSGAAAEIARKRIPPRTKVPVTAFLRLHEPLRGVVDGVLEGRLELYTADNSTTVRVGQREVPLEFESTATIAYGLEGAPVWHTELAGFRFAEKPVLGDGLVMLQPYRAGRIPVVLVHGTASSPARWAEMHNELSNDPLLRDRYQFWLFQYNTGQPVLYSALLLRRALRSVINELDPDRREETLRRMVIIGHSQGGLLTKLMTVKSGTTFWDNVSTAPLAKLDAPVETKNLIQEAMFFEPMSDLERVVFIATPHRGSFRAVGWVQGLIRRLVTLPGRLVSDTQSLFASPAFAHSGMHQLPTSVDNMSPNNKFIRTLADLPIDHRIRAHSIIAVNQPGPVAALNDGVVAYESAHIDGVESELVVRSSHSTQGQPETIEEVRRILREHLGPSGRRTTN